MMLVGEAARRCRGQAGHPFVGPAGRLLDRCLVEAGIERGQIYLSNTVKHFKWVPRGPRRIHSKPNSVEIAACFPWLEAELAAVRPKILVALGATAAQALFGKDFRVTRDRGRLVPSRWAPYALATVHPVVAAARPRRGDPPSRDRPVYRGSENGRGVDARMTNSPDPGPVGPGPARLQTGRLQIGADRGDRRGDRAAGGRHLRRVALSGIGEVEMSAAGWGAMLLGVVLTLALGLGLMSLVFISNRRGYDERGDHRHDHPRR